MIQTVKLAKLVLSEINVRKTIESIEQLAADIAARGVLQNLVVTSVRKPRGAYAVIAGGRRLRALTLLAERGDIDAAQYDVPVLVLAGDDTALSEASLAENFQHLAMSPADECRAFQHFLSGNDDIDGVAKRFGVTRRFVEGRLRLAKLAEPIFAALAAGKITLDLAKAYASTESHDKQLLVWGQYGNSSYASADSIRRVIANEAMSSTDPVALLVGADAYVAAGGTIDRDLFSDNADRWLHPRLRRTWPRRSWKPRRHVSVPSRAWPGSARSPAPAPGKPPATSSASVCPKPQWTRPTKCEWKRSATGLKLSKPRWRTRT